MKRILPLGGSTRIELISLMLRILIAPLILSALLIGCNAPDSNTKEFVKNSGAEEYRTIERGSAIREYILHVPPSYEINTPIPLLINFHGFGGSAYEFSLSTGEGNANLNSLADSQNFMVVYPQGIERSKGGAEWDPGDNGNPDINDNDLYFVEQLILEINNDYNIDLTRVYAAGYSNGGMMAYGLACSRSTQIAAVGIMSGTMLPDICDQNEFTSIIHFHGIEDDVLPYDGNQDFQSVSMVVNFWLNHNHILSSSQITTQLNGGDVIQDVYKSATENLSVVLYKINREYDKPGGHVWFTGDIEGTNPNEVLWEFLSNYSLED